MQIASVMFKRLKRFKLSAGVYNPASFPAIGYFIF